MFYGVASVILGYLIARSTLLSRVLGLPLAISGAGFVIQTFASVLAPAYASGLLLLPVAVAGPSLTLWFLFRGVNVRRWEESAGLAGDRGA